MQRTLLALALLVTAGAAGIAGSPVPLGHAEAVADLVLTGKVEHAPGAPVSGASVRVSEGAHAAMTDVHGRYRLALPARLRGTTVALRVLAIGYTPQARQVLLAQDSTVADFMLVQDQHLMQEVVVTGQDVAGRYGSAAASPSIGLRGATSYTISSIAKSTDLRRDLGGEAYGRITENSFRSPRVAPLSTFGVDVDRASYSIVRRTIMVDRQRPQRDAVRVEEFLNYFPYDYAAPTGEHPVAVHTEVARTPWIANHLLGRIGLRARDIDLASAPANNLVFLIDVSGSMASDDKLPLLKQAFSMLVDQLREQDRVAIVVYAGSEGLALPSTSGANKREILDVIERLHSGGSTAGGAGIKLAYQVAKEHFITGGNNRVILATDGDFNVGVTSAGELERLIEAKRAEGTALTVLGFGAGNIKDDRMEMLADKGNGNYAYIDSPLEARKVLVQEMGGTLVTVAKDVKLQVEFNPAVVAGYRLIGYENRLLQAEDFKDDRKDAGDMGAGHTVTALYEVILAGSDDAAKVPLPDSLRYAAPVATSMATAATNGELMFVKLRYKQPTDSTSTEMRVAVQNRVTRASTDFQFAQAVAAFAMVVRESEHKGVATADLVLEIAQGARGKDPLGYRADFVKLVKAYAALPAAVTADRRDQRHQDH